MRKTAIIVSIILMAGMATAAPSDLARASQTPGDTFYFLDRFSEDLELAVAKSPLGSPALEAKVRANHAEERLTEAQKLAEKNKSEKVDKLMEDYNRQVNLSVKSAKKANMTDLSERLKNVSNRHVEVLRDVEKKVPEQAKKGIQNAIEKNQANQRELEIPDKAKKKDKPEIDRDVPGVGEKPDRELETPQDQINRTKDKMDETVDKSVNTTQNLSSNPEESVENTTGRIEESVTGDFRKAPSPEKENQSSKEGQEIVEKGLSQDTLQNDQKGQYNSEN